MSELFDTDTLLRATARAATCNRRIRDGLNGVLAETGEDEPRISSIRSGLAYARVSAQNLLHSVAEAEGVLNG
jgi:hypothetical protein